MRELPSDGPRPARISVIMITGNVIARSPGQAIFERVLASVAWADELVVVDSASSDGTRDVAARYTDKVYIHPYQNSLKLQKKIALEHVSGDWILWVDADEVLPAALIAEIRAAVAAPRAEGYRIARQHYFVGRLLKHSGDDAPLRLWRRGVGAWGGPENEEVYITPPPVGRLPTPLEHYSSPSLALRLQKIAYFAPAHAAMAALPPRADYTVTDVWRRIVKPSLQQFYGAYWIHRGYKDGVRGFIWAVLCVVADFYNHILLWERAQREVPAEARHAAP